VNYPQDSWTRPYGICQILPRNISSRGSVIAQRSWKRSCILYASSWWN